MKNYLTREEFEKETKGIRDALETTIIQVNAAINIATIAILESKDLEFSIKLFEDTMESTLNTLHFSVVTDEQIAKYRSQYSMIVKTLKESYLKYKKSDQ